MENTIVFEQMQATDTPEVVNLIATAMNKNEGEWAERTINFHFFSAKSDNDDGRRYFVARIGKEIVGIVGLHRYIWGPPDIAWLGWFAVLPKYQGNKIGYHLMNNIIQTAKAGGYRRLLVETYSDEDFEKARTFYERYGFQIVGNVRDYIKDGTDMVVFGLNLK